MLHFWSLLNHLRWSVVRMRGKSKAERTLQMAWPQTNFHLHLSNRHVDKRPSPSLLLGHSAVSKSAAQARNQLNNTLMRGNNLLSPRPTLTQVLGHRLKFGTQFSSLHTALQSRNFNEYGESSAVQGHVPKSPCLYMQIYAYLHLHPHQKTSTRFLLHLRAHTHKEGTAVVPETAGCYEINLSFSKCPINAA